MKTCAICRIKFAPSRQMQVVCSPACAYEYSRKQSAKAETRKALEGSGNAVLAARTPAELSRIYNAEIERYRGIARSINLQPQ